MRITELANSDPDHSSNSIRPIVLLGSASERLDKKPKRLLCERIVLLSSLMLDRLYRLFPKVEFAELKAELMSDEELRKGFQLAPDQPIEERHRTFVSTIIDAYEFQLLGSPLRAILEFIGNSAGHPVLRQSVAAIDVDGKIENLIARTWAAEIDAEKGKAELEKAMTALPEILFLRYTLSTYFMTRVFWNHWEVQKRLALLDVADVAIKPFKQIDKGRIQRGITEKKDRS
jgi:hypothetical protein